MWGGMWGQWGTGENLDWGRGGPVWFWFLVLGL